MLSEPAPAKVNTCLFLGAVRDDGRHELVSVMQSLAWGDDVTLEPAEADEVVCPGVDGPNLAAQALAAFRAATGWAAPARVTIEKRIPVAAGLGGGSADAAAVLRLAARAVAGAEAPGFAATVDRGAAGDLEAELFALAPGLGADVPAQIRPGRVLATGAGERLETLSPPPGYGVLVVPSAHALSTGAVYREADRLGLPRSPTDLAARLDEVRAGAGEGPFGLPAELLVNDLEPAARRLCPAIDVEIERVRALGAGHVMVSGSGPTVLGLFAEAAAARAAAEALPGSIATTPLGA